MSWWTDISVIARAIGRVNVALFQHQQQELQRFWRNSSIKLAAQDICNTCEDKLSDTIMKQTAVKKVIRLFEYVNICIL